MSKHILQKGKFLNFVQDGNWEFVERVNETEAVCGIVWLGGKLLVVEQHRPATGETVLELPAGLIDAGETAVQAIVREIAEETGCQISKGSAQHTRKSFSSPGLTNESVHIIEFNDDKVYGLGAQKLDSTEDITVRLWTPETIMNSEMTLGSRLAAYLMGIRHAQGYL